MVPRHNSLDSFSTSTRTAAAAVVTMSMLVLGCSKSSDGHTADTGAPVAAAATATPKAGGSGGESVHLEVTGGANAGIYDEAVSDGGCSYGLAGKGAWGNQYSVDASDAKKFSSLQLVVPDAKSAASGTSTFHMTVGFGPLFGQGHVEYDVDTRSDAPSKHGSGTVTVEDHGSTGKVTFDAKTADGVGLKGTIDCHSVMRNG